MVALPYRYPYIGPFYVATTGSDTTGDGSASNPWATPGKAATFIRSNYLNVTQIADITVNVRAGTYPMTSRLALTEADGGYNGHRVIYTCPDGAGLAVLDGGSTVSGWSDQGGNVWRASIPSACYTVYRDGVRMRPARFPKLVVNPSFPVAQAPYLRTADNGSSFTVLKYVNGDFDPSAWSVSDLQVVIQTGGNFNWLSDTHTVVAKDTVNKLLTFGESAKFYTYRGGIGSRYFVQGVLQLLTEDGEFYIDRLNGYLYVYSVGNPGGLHTYVIPRTTELVSINGSTADRRAKNLTFDGFTFQNTDFLPWFSMGWPSNAGGTLFGPSHQDTFYPYWDSMPNARLGAVTARHCEAFTFTRCHFQNIGTTGIYATGWAKSHTVQNCLIERLGISGIVQEGPYSGEGDCTGGWLYDNLKVRYMGELADHATGIQIGNSGNNTVQHAEFSDGPRHGTWYYGSFNQALQTVYTKNNQTKYCKYLRLCQRTGDTAGVYVESLSSLTGGPYNTNYWEQIIADGCAAEPSMTDFAPNGVFTDDQTYGQSFVNVQVTNTQGNQHRTNSSGEHTLTNTSFLANGLPNGAFNPALMDTANIGVTAGFPF